MRRFLLVFPVMAVLGLTFAYQSFAEPKVGKLDGAAGPSLPAVATPGLSMGGTGMVQQETLADTQLPAFMEKNGDWRGAATAWQTVAHDSLGQARTRALLRAGNALEKSGDFEGAARFYLGILPNAGSLAGEVVYGFSRALDGRVETQTRRKLGAELAHAGAPQAQDDANDLAWRQAGIYRMGWREALDGKVAIALTVPDAPLPQLNELQRRVKALESSLAVRVGTAGMVGAVMPGLGHAWLGEERVAAGILPLWALAMWLVLWHTRRRQWPYAVLWGLVTLGLWAGSILTAMALARTQNADLRMETIEGWADLRPREPADGQAPALPQLGVAMPLAHADEHETTEDTQPEMQPDMTPEAASATSATEAVSMTVVATPTVSVKAGDVFVMRTSGTAKGISGSVTR